MFNAGQERRVAQYPDGLAGEEPRAVSRGLQLHALWILPTAAAIPMDTS